MNAPPHQGLSNGSDETCGCIQHAPYFKALPLCMHVIRSPLTLSNEHTESAQWKATPRRLHYKAPVCSFNKTKQSHTQEDQLPWPKSSCNRRSSRIIPVPRRRSNRHHSAPAHTPQAAKLPALLPATSEAPASGPRMAESLMTKSHQTQHACGSTTAHHSTSPVSRAANTCTATLCSTHMACAATRYHPRAKRNGVHVFDARNRKPPSHVARNVIIHPNPAGSSITPVVGSPPLHTPRNTQQHPPLLQSVLGNHSLLTEKM